MLFFTSWTGTVRVSSHWRMVAMCLRVTAFWLEGSAVASRSAHSRHLVSSGACSSLRTPRSIRSQYESSSRDIASVSRGLSESARFQAASASRRWPTSCVISLAAASPSLISATVLVGSAWLAWLVAHPRLVVLPGGEEPVAFGEQLLRVPAACARSAPRGPTPMSPRSGTTSRPIRNGLLTRFAMAIAPRSLPLPHACAPGADLFVSSSCSAAPVRFTSPRSPPPSRAAGARPRAGPSS